jgi:hypothetical protein
MAERRLVVQILGDSRSLERAFSRSSRASKQWGDSINRAARGGVVATVGFRGLGRSVAFASGAFLGGAGFVAGARAAIGAASDLGEEINKTNVLFSTNAGEIRRWSRTTATSIGLSQRAALAAAGNFGAMFETLRLGDDVSSRMSRQLVTLGADLASFSNQDPAEMLDRLRSGLAGEAEPLRRFGILLSEARVQQEAYTSGIAKTGAKLTEQQKVLARFNLILKDSVAAQGDFARTSQSQANQERINAALREQAAERIGKVLLPAYNQATRAVNKWLGEEKNLVRAQKATKEALKIGTDAARAFRDVIETMAPVVQRVNRLLGGTENSVKLLLSVMVAGKIVAFTGALTGLSAQALVATGRVNALRFAMLRLGAIGAVTIGIELLINRKAIAEKGMNLRERFLESLGLNAGPGTNEFVPPILTGREREDAGTRVGRAQRAVQKRLAAERAAEAKLEALRREQREARRKEREALERERDVERRARLKAEQEEREALRQQELRDAQAEAAARRRERLRLRPERRRARQFEALGLTGEGAERVPGVGALRRRLGTLRTQIEGTILDTPKTRAQLARIAKVLSGQFGKVGRDVRAAILQMFSDINSALGGTGGGGPQTKARKLNINTMLAGIGLSEEELRELRSRLSQQTTTTLGAGRPRPRSFSTGTAGVGGGVGGTFVIHNHIHLDGQKIASSTTRHQQRARRRQGGSRAGVNPGGVR